MKATNVLQLTILTVLAGILLALLWDKIEHLFESGIQGIRGAIRKNRDFWADKRIAIMKWRTKFSPEFSIPVFLFTAMVTALLVVACVADFRLLKATFEVLWSEEVSSGINISALFAIVFVALQVTIGLVTCEFLGLTNLRPFDDRFSQAARKRTAIFLIACLGVLAVLNSYFFIWRVENGGSDEGTSPLMMGLLGFVLPFLTAALGYVVGPLLKQLGAVLSYLAAFFLWLIDVMSCFVMGVVVFTLMTIRLILRVISWIGELLLGLFKKEDARKHDHRDDPPSDPPSGPTLFVSEKVEVDEQLEYLFREQKQW